MTRKRNRKSKSKAETKTTEYQVKSVLNKNSSDRMDTDVEDPEGGTRKQESAWKRYIGYIRHPSWFIDIIFSSFVRIQLFMYQRVAGRLPLFLKENVADSKQEITELTKTVNKLNKTRTQLTSDNESLQKTNAELLDTNIALSAKKEELEQSKQTLSDTIDALTDKKDLLKDKDELLTEIEELGKENSKLADDNTNLETNNRELENENKERNGKTEQLQNEKKYLENKIEDLNDKNIRLENKNKTLDDKNKELSDKKIELNECIGKLTQLKGASDEKVITMSKEIESLKQELDRYEDMLTAVVREKTELISRINTLSDEKNEMEAEKHDALRRLSEQVSVKLRDNNPNIVDLSDECRPTKLAEMFSELYDNEWTNAFSVLEETFSEEQTIVILLDTVMIAYGFCEERVNERWQALTDWFLDENLPGAQQTTKWLKDSRKTNIQKKVPVIEKNFLETILSMCDDENLEALLCHNDIKIYFTKCIELCLLMVATDPPVILVCPGWKASPSPQKDDTKTSEKSKEEKPVIEESEKENCSQIEPIKVSDNNQHTRGGDEEAFGDDAETSVVEEQQDETEKSYQNQMVEMIDCNKCTSHDKTEQGKNDSRQEHEQQHTRQQQNDGFIHVDTEESWPIGEPQPEDHEQHLKQEPEVKDQNDGTSHDIIKSVVLEDSAIPELQDNSTEKEQEQENGDNGIRYENNLATIEQQEFQKEGSNENVLKDNYESIEDATEKDEIGLQQTGLQESPYDTEAGASHKENKEESQLKDDNMIADDESKLNEKKDIKFGAMECISDREYTSTLYKTEEKEGTEIVPNASEDPPERLIYGNEGSFNITATKEDTDGNKGDDKTVHPHLEKDGNKNDTNENNDVPGDSPINDQHNNGNAKSANDEMEQATPVLDEKRPVFDKDLFKEYTRRGKYLDFIVWPAMCLHKNGPLLHKGVAQGRKDQNVVQNGSGWTWRSSN